MTEPETLLRETFRSRERLIDGVEPLPAAVRTRAAQQQRRRTWVAVVASGLAVAVLAAGVAAVANRSTSSLPADRNHSSTPVSPHPSASSPSAISKESPIPPAVAGWQVVSTLGLEVSIPADWPLGANRCGAASQSTFLFADQAVESCASGEAPTVTSVRVDRGVVPKALGAETKIRTRHLSVDGHRATERTSTMADGRTRVVLRIPDRDVYVLVVGPEVALIDKILASTRVVKVDLNGCPIARLPRQSWDPPSTQAPVQVGQPDSFSVCFFEHDRLLASQTLRGAQAAAVVSALDRALPGKLPDVPQECLPSVVADQHVTLVAHSSTKGNVPLVMYYQDCLDRYVASPTGISQVTVALLDAVLRPLKVSYDFQGGMPKG